MLIYAGIDEAGYGPLLGPLCVAATVFEVADWSPGEGSPNLWSMLGRAVTRSRKDKRQRIAVDDSKRLKTTGSAKQHPLACLERGVLAFVAAASGGLAPANDADLVGVLGGCIAERPWYRSLTDLPMANDADRLRIDVARLTRGFDAAGVRIRSMHCRLVEPDELNDGVRRTGTKADVNLETAIELVRCIRDAHPDAEPRIIVDRQGGRVRYGGALERAFPGAAVEVIAEAPELGRYRVVDGGRPMVISFLPCAEERHLPVALASMTAKYVRELCMLRLNGHFTELMPELRPTAGYLTDGRRFLADIEPLVAQQRYERMLLVRAV